MAILFLKRLSNNKGVSEVIGYVFLVVVAIGLSALVYFFLSRYVPLQKEQVCPEGISVSLDKINCTLNPLNISFVIKNDGLFNISGFIIRANDVLNSRVGYTQIGLIQSSLSPSESILFYNETYTIGGIKSTLTLLEIIPYVNINNKRVLCESRIYSVKCSFNNCAFAQNSDGSISAIECGSACEDYFRSFPNVNYNNFCPCPNNNNLWCSF